MTLINKVVLCIGVCVGCLMAQTPQKLTLDEFITTALLMHPQREALEHSYLSQVQHSLSAEGIYDWNVFLNAYYSKGSTFFTTYYPEINALTFTGGASHTFEKYGTQFSASSTILKSSNNPDEFSSFVPSEYATLSMDFSIKQPLIKNSYGIIEKMTMEQSGKTKELAIIKLEEDLEDLIVFYTNTYLDWVLYYKGVENLQAQEKKAQDQVELVSRQLKRGAAENLDLAQAKQNLSSKRLQLLASKEQFSRQTILIQSFLSGQFPLAVSSGTALMPESDSIELPSVGRTQAYSYIERSNIKHLLDIQESILQLNTDIAKENTKKQLDLVVSKTFTNYQDAIGDLASGIDGGYSFGVELALPLKNSRAEHEHASMEESLKSLQYSNLEAIRQLSVSVRTLFDSIESVNLQIQQVKELITYSKEYESEEQKKYNQGRSASQFFILSAQDRTLASILTLEQLKIQRLKLLNQLSGVLDLYASKYTIFRTER